MRGSTSLAQAALSGRSRPLRGCYDAAMHTPQHVVLVGPMGAGKSSIGPGLAARLTLPFVDLDARIEALEGASVADIFATRGEAAFRQLESAALRAALAGSPAVIATGGGAVLAADNRAAMRHAARVVYLQVSPGCQLQRIGGDPARPLLRAPDPARRLAELQERREGLYREVAHVVFDTTAHSPGSAVDALSAALQPQAAPA